MTITHSNRSITLDSQRCGTFSYRCILALAAYFICLNGQTIASFAEDLDLVDPVHRGSLLTADFGTNHDQTVPEVWEYAGD